ncbi:MAG: phosphoribosyl-AMP cyclohydrolase [Gammaproteobacteria bacterium]|nr:phosphoribosyl-AMP cyclohydrolase [Gammaproteobacteria bacterium]
MMESVVFNESGLVPVITQDALSGQVLMFAWMNQEALELTVQHQRAVYYSRSRQKLWFKGEESGHVQHLKDLRLDCDGDVLLMKVEQVGGIACHTGRTHCFFRQLDDAGGWKVSEPVVKSPEEIYSSGDA